MQIYTLVVHNVANIYSKYQDRLSLASIKRGELVLRWPCFEQFGALGRGGRLALEERYRLTPPVRFCRIGPVANAAPSHSGGGCRVTLLEASGVDAGSATRDSGGGGAPAGRPRRAALSPAASGAALSSALRSTRRGCVAGRGAEGRAVEAWWLSRLAGLRARLGRTLAYAPVSNAPGHPVARREGGVAWSRGVVGRGRGSGSGGGVPGRAGGRLWKPRRRRRRWRGRRRSRRNRVHTPKGVSPRLRPALPLLLVRLVVVVAVRHGLARGPPPRHR